MTLLNGVNLLPASGEWVYDTVPHRSQQVTQPAPVVQNLHAAPAGSRTDYSFALDQLQAQHPECTTVSLVVAWFGASTDVTACKIYPSTTYPGGGSDALVNGVWTPDPWRCSGLTQGSPGLIPISQAGGDQGANYVYGGTPADGAVVRCIQDLKARGLRVVFYPFILMDCSGYPWRGRIGFNGADVGAAATSAVTAFLGAAALAQFTRDAANLTVAYAGSSTDYTYRRMILHYANLCVVAGGVDLFLVGSELRGLETIRGPAWTPAGTLDANGHATWDYPFVAGLAQIASDVRSVFDGAGLTRDPTGLHNLVTYSADWSVWMGVQHAGALGPNLGGQWPHLDSLYAAAAIDLVAFDNYLPLSDWTSGSGGLDAANWQGQAPTTWPPGAATMNGLGLTGAPSLRSLAYLKANIEGGEKYNWFYTDSTNDGRGPDPNGSDQPVSRPEGDRLAQARNPYLPGQQLLANKMLRWWWNNPHQAVYDTGDGLGQVPRGPATAWAPQSKSITFAEYGFPTTDRCTNQPNVFYDPKSSESFTPFWSAWRGSEGGGFAPVLDPALAQLGLQAVVEYWVTDGNNAVSATGTKMIEPTFMSAWNWDARPFPVFPALGGVWGDAANWPAGNWLNGKGPVIAAPVPDAAPPPVPAPTFPALAGQAWSARYRPVFRTLAAAHVSGREARAARRASVRWEIELAFDLLRMDDSDLQTLAGVALAARGEAGLVLVPVPAELGQGATLLCRFADDTTDLEAFMDRLWRTRTLTLVSVPA